MDAKETVQKGLQARKDARAAEIRAEKLREDVTAANDARFREQLSYRKAKRSWQAEKEILVGDVYRQRRTIRQLREENEQLRQKEAYAKRVSALVDIVKYGVIFVGLVWIQDTGWIVSWLNSSLIAVSATCLFFAAFTWVHGRK